MNPTKIPLEDVMRYQYEEPKRREPSQGIAFPSSDLPLWEKIKERVTVREMVEQYVDLNAKGIGKCPFHDDNNPSLSVNEKENYWNCFSGCGSGSVIDFWMKLNNMDFRDAMNDLAGKLGI